MQYLYFKTKFRKCVNLLLLPNFKNYHYVLIKDFDRFMTNKTNHHVKNIFIDIAYSASLAQKYQSLTEKIAINHTKSVLLPEEVAYIIFKILKDDKTPLIMYVDFEYVLIPSTNNTNFAPNTKKYQNHIHCSYGYKLVRIDGRYICKMWLRSTELVKTKLFLTSFGRGSFQRNLLNF